jgi:hypothetical protein
MKKLTRPGDVVSELDFSSDLKEDKEDENEVSGNTW